MSTRLTQAEWRAVNAALAEILAGEWEPAEGTSEADYRSAKAKVEKRIRWKAGELA